ncbi:MAG: hypothetical protein FJ146_15700 [Deltaproteobacteria bacterium]|nr:hypothetical protein [Deltaproteobacteria bacterium]
MTQLIAQPEPSLRLLDHLKDKYEALRDWAEPRQKLVKTIGVSVLLVVLYWVIQLSDTKAQISTTPGTAANQPSRVLGTSSVEAISRSKERRLERYSKDLTTTLQDVNDSIAKLDQRIATLEGRPPNTSQAQETPPTDASISGGSLTTTALPAQQYQGQMVPQLPPVVISPPSRGESVISFPTQGTAQPEKAEVVLPAGSYVKAKLLTGVEAPEGRTYPVLLQLDFAHIVPNNKSIDLKGCFVIAKAEGDLSTERVQMQATKLSCVARNGQMFEREINGFVADARDNSFSVTGTVNTKQDRVAAMAFLAAVVDGIGKSVQLAQTSNQTFPNGSQTQIISGNQGRYLAAGGAASAASQVTQWYLKEAQNLLPTINVGSGQDVWIVLNDTVALPHTYFRLTQEGGSHDKDYKFTNRLLD